jgi:uncharacterized protein involved in type VI secretion and phage assembly
MPCDLHRAGKANGYTQHFDAVARDLPWRPALEDDHGLCLNPRPTVPGVQTVIVVGLEGETSPGASDPSGCLKVTFHLQQAHAFDYGSSP